jgi:hyaluronoglucosaminidase
MQVELGTIEGFYGEPWSWDARRETAVTLKEAGYGFYLYAPKGDPYLRRRWRERHPEEWWRGLAGFADACRGAGVRFGIGLSPYEVYRDFGQDTRDALAEKLKWLDELGLDDLAVLFDDMRGDDPELADRQLEIVEWVRGRTSASRLFLCPTYYTDDPVLDRVFGQRPEGYLERLGEGLTSDIEIFWTGEEVVSREISPGHIERVREMLGRKPFLWDNYPVNDGQRMSRYLHLRGFTGRPGRLAEQIAGHGVNPALQPMLSRIPMLTLAERYRQRGGYEYGAAMREAARQVAGAALGEMLWKDVLVLQDVGLDRLTDEQRSDLRERYGAHDHDAAREVLRWLDGDYGITDEIVQTQ